MASKVERPRKGCSLEIAIGRSVHSTSDYDAFAGSGPCGASAATLGSVERQMEIPGHGTFAIYIQGGIHHCLWQR